MEPPVKVKILLFEWVPVKGVSKWLLQYAVELL